jgi:hypothetical protein
MQLFDADGPFWFCGYAKGQPKDQPITDESDLENKLTDIWEYVCRDVLQLVFFEWMDGKIGVGHRA